jgi:hypothetical protein
LLIGVAGQTRFISERTRRSEGPQRRGVKVKLTAKQVNHARKLIDNGEATTRYVADLLNVDRSKLYRAFR